MAEYNNQSIDIDLEDMFNSLSDKDQEEFLVDMFSNLPGEEERAVEIDDPALNIIMMHLGLYEGVHDKNASKVISRLRKLITDNQKSGE